MRYKSFGLILIILTITISGCKSVETKNFNITIQDKLKNVDKFTKSSIFSEKCEFGSWSSVGWRIKARSLHKKKKWLKLANNIYTLENCYALKDLRLSYYYLGRSAEELGYYTAAIEYYKLSKNSNHCDDNDNSCGDGYVNPNLNTELHLNIIKEAGELRSKFKPVIEASILKTKDLISSIQKSNTFHQDKWELFKNIVKEYKKVRGEYSLNSVLRKDRRLRILKTRIFSLKKELKRISSSEFEYFSGSNDDFFELYPVKIDQSRIIANSEKFIKQLKSKPYKDIVITIKALELDTASNFRQDIFDILIQKSIGGKRFDKPVPLFDYISALRIISNSDINLPDNIFNNYKISYTEMNNINTPIMSISDIDKFDKINSKTIHSDVSPYLIILHNNGCNSENKDKLIKIKSEYVSGYRSVHNPKYTLAVDTYNRAVRAYNTSKNLAKGYNKNYKSGDYWMETPNYVLSDLSSAKHNLERTDREVVVNTYSDYEFAKKNLTVEKNCGIDFYIIDKLSKKFLKVTIFQNHSKQFNIVRNLHAKDVNYSVGDFNDEDDIKIYKDKSFSTSLLNSILDNSSKYKLQSYSNLEKFISTLAPTALSNNTNKESKGSNSSYIDDLEKIKDLLDEGVINNDEFKNIKKKIIDNM